MVIILNFFQNAYYNFLDGINDKKMQHKERITDSMIQTFYEYEGRKALNSAAFEEALEINLIYKKK